MGATRKTRILSSYSGECVSTFGNTPNVNKFRVEGRQVTVSQEHPEWKTLQRAKKDVERQQAFNPTPNGALQLQTLRNLDVGGDFYTSKRVGTLISPEVYQNRYRATPDTILSYRGPFLAYGSPIISWDNTVWPTLPVEQDELYLAYAKGTVAISRTAPTVPVVSLANLLGELRNDGLPSIIGSLAWRAQGFRKKTKSLGDEYLNVEFGWKPLVSDIIKIAHAVKDSERIINEYEARSGQNIGRHYSFPDEKSTEVRDLGLGTPFPSLNSYAYSHSPTGRKTLSIETTKSYWFQGTYTYYLPQPDEARLKVFTYAAKAEKLLGLALTPEVLWNLAPWTWFADWFVNVGSIMTNISAFGKENLMLRRGYIMCETHTKHTYGHPGIGLYGARHTGPIAQVFESHSKVRRRASPYGFGLTFGGFSVKQMAIMAALGVSRSSL